MEEKATKKNDNIFKNKFKKYLKPKKGNFRLFYDT